MPGMASNHTLEDKYLNGLLAAVEMIRKGCTTCYDLFFEFPMPSRDGIEPWALPIGTRACGP